MTDRSSTTEAMQAPFEAYDPTKPQDKDQRIRDIASAQVRKTLADMDRERIHQMECCIRYFAVVVKSGQQWDTVCQDAYDAAMRGAVSDE
jgi:hypothetical protein